MTKTALHRKETGWTLQCSILTSRRNLSSPHTSDTTLHQRHLLFQMACSAQGLEAILLSLLRWDRGHHHAMTSEEWDQWVVLKLVRKALPLRQ